MDSNKYKFAASFGGFWEQDADQKGYTGTFSHAYGEILAQYLCNFEIPVTATTTDAKTMTISYRGNPSQLIAFAEGPTDLKPGFTKT